MIKITKAIHVEKQTLALEFSDGTRGECDLSATLSRESPLTIPLREPDRFREFFLDMGALCWPNGLELSPRSLQARMAAAGHLVKTRVA